MDAPLRMLRRPEVERRTGLSCSTIYARIAARTFPSPIQLGGNVVAWLEAEIDDWIAARIAASRMPAEPRRRAAAMEAGNGGAP